jgi:3-oxocholest-4-en-26-oate---CoA ligase
MAPAGGWAFADVWEVVARQVPDAPALVHGERRVSWRDLDRRADGVAAALLDAGLAQQDKVAHYLYNCPEFLESLLGIWKAGLVPVNTNYRYADDELVYLWENGDVVAVVFHGAFAETVERVRGRVPGVRLWLWVDDGSGPCPAWAVPYESAAGGPAVGGVRAPWGRSGDDLYLLYTGGTTGMPKGVMWRQDDLFRLLNATAKVRFPEDGGLDDVAAMIERPGPVLVPACPLMHGTGAFAAFAALSSAGCVVTLTERRFSVEELLDTVEREGVQSLAIVGDAFAKPMLRALDEAPGRWDISSLRVVTSSGVMWSAATKEGLLRHNPRLILVDSLGSSEAVGMASSISKGGEGVSSTARFRLSENTRVITDDDRFVEPGSGEIGMVAIRGLTPVGYYKDEAKTAATFRVVGGERFSIPGDYATVEADGTLTLLGRGSVCINTGGEKVFPEEVEEVLKEHPGVRDAVVVGVPDERFGETIAAVVEAQPGVDGPAADEVIAHVKARLAHYKAPRRVLPVDSLARAANGKVDYRRWKAYAAERS